MLRAPALPVSRLRTKALGFVGMLAVVGSGFTMVHQLSSAASTPVVPAYDHIFFVIDENHSYSQVIGPAPYLTGLANANAKSTEYYAVTHPSVNNYLALFSGQTYSGITDSCTAGGSCATSAPNLADEVLASGRSVKGYMESMPSACYLPHDAGTYTERHNPFPYFNQIRTTARCAQEDVPYTQLATDLASTATTPNYVWITPNLQDDMHDGTVAQGDAWAKANFPTIFNSPAWTTQHSLLVFTTDEDDFTTVNKVPFFAVASDGSVKTGYTSTVHATHYSLLRTIESAWGLGALTTNDAAAQPMADLFTTAGPLPTPTPTGSPTPTGTPTATPAPTPTPGPTPTPAPTPTPSPTPTPAPGSGPRLVQSAGSTSTSVQLPAASTRGNLLVLAAGLYTGVSRPINAVTDGVNTWTRIGAYASAGHYSRGEMWYAANAAPVTTVTVTTDATPLTLELMEFSGVQSDNPLTSSNGASNTGTAADSGSVTPGVNDGLAVGFIAGHTSIQAISVTSPDDTVLPQLTSGTASVIAGWSALSTSDPQSIAGSFASSMYWAAGIATFKTVAQPAGPAPSPTPPPTPTPASTPTPTPTSTPTPAPTPTPTPGPGGSTWPIRAAFYYPWYPETWSQGSRFHPTLGQYNSGDPTLIAQHIAAMQYGHITAGIASWFGPGTAEDGRIQELLNVAHGTGFNWALYYEREGYSNPTSDQIGSDLSYASKYFSDPSYLHVNGKPVLFVYAAADDACGMATRWAAARTSVYLVLKVFNGYLTCADQPDSWHQYAPASREDHQGTNSFSVSPGFFKTGESSARLARDPGAFAKAVHDMVASGSHWQLVTTFNEWIESTSVEDATEWQTASGWGSYLDILHQVS